MAAPRSVYPVLSWIVFLVAAASIATAEAASKKGDAGSPRQVADTESIGEWRLVRTPDPKGGPEAISIMHTADASRSDFDFAGLTIRCGKTNPELLLVLLRAFPLRERMNVVFGKADNESRFDATVAPPGTAVLLPGDATRLVTTSWQSLKEVFIQIETGETNIHGVVALAGLQPAFKLLTANCSGR